MSFMDNIKDMAGKASEEIKKASELAQTNNSDANIVPNTDLMNNFKSIASKAGVGLKDASKKMQENYAQDQVLAGNDLKSRHKMTDTDLEDAWARAKAQMFVKLSPDAESYLQDLIFPDEEIIYKIRNTYKGKVSQLVLTDRSLYIVSKGVRGGQADDIGGGIIGMALAIGQISVRVYPLNQIIYYEIMPMKGLTNGHLQFFTSSTSEHDSETKLMITDKLGYFKIILLYRKLVELKSLS